MWINKSCLSYQVANFDIEGQGQKNYSKYSNEYQLNGGKVLIFTGLMIWFEFDSAVNDSNAKQLSKNLDASQCMASSMIYVIYTI